MIAVITLRLLLYQKSMKSIYFWNPSTSAHVAVQWYQMDVTVAGSLARVSWSDCHRRLLLSLFGHVVSWCFGSAVWWWCPHCDRRCHRFLVAFLELPCRISTVLGRGCSMLMLLQGVVLPRRFLPLSFP